MTTPSPAPSSASPASQASDANGEALPGWPRGFDAIEFLRAHVAVINRDLNFGDCEDCKLTEYDLCAAMAHYDAAMARCRLAVEALQACSLDHVEGPHIAECALRDIGPLPAVRT